MKIINASFRDPAGVVYQEQGLIYRKINTIGFTNYNHFMASGLYDALVKKHLIIPHQEILKNPHEIIIKPEKIPFISYPYEWCFSQLQDAALLTLEISKMALDFGMWLKDASAFNIQFYQGKPIFIDTLSFEIIPTGKPWGAYQQFCRHFLGPLALMSYTDNRLATLLKTNIDGIPLDLVAKLLPVKTKFKLGLYIHIHLHAKYQTKYANTSQGIKEKNISVFQTKALIDSLESIVKKIKTQQTKTEWGEYYTFTNYEKNAFAHKKQLISAYLEKMAPTVLVDLGSNDGHMSQLATQKNIFCIASDIDPIAVEKNYLQTKINHDKFMLPLIQDLVNPSPSIGWHHHERDCFLTRINTDCAMALALIHHLAIANNLPFEKIANYLAEISPHLIIEFVPKNDSKVQILLQTREDIFSDYTIENFEKVFSEKYHFVEKEKINGSERILYWMRKKELPHEQTHN